MSWDEAVFSYFLKKAGRFTRKSDRGSSERVRLEDVAPRLRLLACALTGESLEIIEAEGAGGYSGDRLLLPAEMSLFSSRTANWKAYLFRLLYSVASRRLGRVLPGNETSEKRIRFHSILSVRKTLACIEKELPLGRALLEELGAELAPKLSSSESSARNPWIVYLHLACRFPGPAGVDPSVVLAGENLLRLAQQSKSSARIDCDPLMDAALDPIFMLFGCLMAASNEREKSASAPPDGFTLESLSTGTEKRGKTREKVEEVKLGESKEDENPLVHVFEKVLTADDYLGGKKNLDGSDELDDHQEAIDELNLRHVVRSRDRAQSIYKSDVMLDSGAPDLEEEESPEMSSYLYDEWDYKKRDYRREWCSVHVQKPATSRLDSLPAMARSDEAMVKKLRAELKKIVTERRWKRRLADGTEMDLDSVIEAQVDLACGQTPTEKVYMDRRRSERDIAVSILIDMSLSTDSWVADKHVIQVSRDSVLILSRVLEGLASKVSVAGFYSNTRQDCRFLELKTFDEGWQTFRARLGNVTPTGYTRIGPALRHATAGLCKEGSRKKLLLLLSDGKPTDFDRYEGQYGIQDVRQAIKEASQKGVKVRSLAIEAEAKFYLPQMFGSGGFQILPHPALLAPALSKVFAQCLA